MYGMIPADYIRLFKSYKACGSLFVRCFYGWLVIYVDIGLMIGPFAYSC